MSKRNGKKHIPEPQVTSALEWRRLYEESKHGYVITLSSGFVVRLRPVSMEGMLRRGEIPDLLTPMAAKTVFVEVDGHDLTQTMKSVESTFNLLDFICGLAFLEPRIVDEPTADDEISVEYLHTNDKLEVFQLVTAPGWVMRTFRDQQSADVAALQDGQSVRATAVEPATGG